MAASALRVASSCNARLTTSTIPSSNLHSNSASCVSRIHRRPLSGGRNVNVLMRSQPLLLPASTPSRRSILLKGILTSQFCRVDLARASSASMAKNEEEQPSNFKYVQLWVSEDGESHIKECKMSGFSKKSYSSMPQFVRDDFGGQPEKITFTELSVGLEQPLHTCPQVQFVVTLSGSWYIKTTDGKKFIFKAGDVLFQDNTDTVPAKKPGQHYSGTVGDVPCQQFIAQFNRKPEVDNPEPF